ncbi:hypothetical protein [Acetobacter oeni]|uniref:SMODS and SLOG-associating 2TM effector domain-containing protein n=1 Tax=Acetobacter oeni TaxID=304077 RepID=A0A511XKU6_9PROT|nr:hypothetical protein [Acetobacter oeni]MBB3883821.1 hypothetical protein [Acetobacter oeni]NHO19838.1 hypothetical protein [Acetobacter oeni]GBR10503.1 hypothetical protein AA21952_3095 [Acetobacter oeni LMG 21952]GEN63573.1 hypothetical protein AOE01nite_17970 [Acetobacter oeni]
MSIASTNPADPPKKLLEIGILTDEDRDDPHWGAAGADYRLWRTKEAISQAEKMLTSEASALSAHEARATSLIGWLSAEMLATAAAVAAHPCQTRLFCALGVILPGLICGWNLSRVFFEKKWSVAGIHPSWLLRDYPEACELTMLEEIAKHYVQEIDRNEKILAATFRFLRMGWLSFLAIPLVAIVWLALIGLLTISFAPV